MGSNAISMAKYLLYFNDITPPETRKETYSLFYEVWEKIPPQDKLNIEEHLELIIIKPINDPLQPDTVAISRVSPTEPTWLSWIIWNPYISTLNRISKIFLLSHEFAHVHLLHPQKNEDKKKAEDEANNYTLKIWKIKPSLDDKKWFPKLDY